MLIQLETNIFMFDCMILTSGDRNKNGSMRDRYVGVVEREDMLRYVVHVVTEYRTFGSGHNFI